LEEPPDMFKRIRDLILSLDVLLDQFRCPGRLFEADVSRTMLQYLAEVFSFALIE
jgi:hypothetical protein